MNPTNDLLRRYLLGDVTELEREQFELSLLTDAQVLLQLEIVEEELIDAFVDNELTETETRKFLDHCAVTKEQRGKIRFAAALKRAAKAQV
jgi:hypothetical protein